MSSLLKLHYFDLAARAEPIRLSFAIQGIPFIDHRISRDEWAKNLKPNHVFPLDQLPVLEFPDGKMAVQSYAILRYVASVSVPFVISLRLLEWGLGCVESFHSFQLRPSYGLYPDDPLERLRVDQLMETFADIREKTRVVNVMQDSPAKEAAREVRRFLLLISCGSGRL
ncbi:glutathione Stransferase [Perkinsus olseni]|uniref:Glutathione Stransferase n=1 Tax=Perkinsus olseni TaxID=32597 RepID=A0A7J6Q9S2_PEROL|nr:glutathione Stransferase [Perkinsus olseni]